MACTKGAVIPICIGYRERGPQILPSFNGSSLGIGITELDDRGRMTGSHTTADIARQLVNIAKHWVLEESSYWTSVFT